MLLSLQIYLSPPFASLCVTIGQSLKSQVMDVHLSKTALMGRGKL